jgi:hypothetical protein
MEIRTNFKKAIFLSPKVYGGVLNNNLEVTKIKGFKDKVSYQELNSLLIKDKKLELNQNKWLKSIVKGNITIKNSIYSLVATKIKDN